MWNFKGYLWNSKQNIVPIHWKINLLWNIEILRALRVKSSYALLKRPPGGIFQYMPPNLLNKAHQIPNLKCFVSSCSCLCPIENEDVVGAVQINYSWALSNFIVFKGVTYIRGLAVSCDCLNNDDGENCWNLHGVNFIQYTKYFTMPSVQ